MHDTGIGTGCSSRSIEWANIYEIHANGLSGMGNSCRHGHCYSRLLAIEDDVDHSAPFLTAKSEAQGRSRDCDNGLH